MYSDLIPLIFTDTYPRIIIYNVKGFDVDSEYIWKLTMMLFKYQAILLPIKFFSQWLYDIVSSISISVLKEQSCLNQSDILYLEWFISQIDVCDCCLYHVSKIGGIVVGIFILFYVVNK